MQRPSRIYGRLAQRFAAIARGIRSMDRPSRVRGIYSLALLGASIVLTAMSIWLVWIVWRGGWGADRQEQQLGILGTALLTMLGGVLAGMGFLAIGGPVGRVKAETKIGSLEVADDSDARHDGSDRSPE